MCTCVTIYLTLTDWLSLMNILAAQRAASMFGKTLFYLLLTEQYTVCLDQPEVVVKGLMPQLSFCLVLRINLSAFCVLLFSPVICYPVMVTALLPEWHALRHTQQHNDKATWRLLCVHPIWLTVQTRNHIIHCTSDIRRSRAACRISAEYLEKILQYSIFHRNEMNDTQK